MRKPTLLLILSFLFIFSSTLISQDTISPNSLADSLFSGLIMRNIGPASNSGRIADIAIHPENESIWYVAVGSGGVWKTVNSGTTWTPIFDDQNVYSTGCITIDQINPNTIWLGTGENVGGRHVGFGDGIYKSTDGGNSWKNMGLKNSEHISEIIVHPKNSNIIWVAAQGPLWTKGGDRGFYVSTDGGENWHKTLGDDEWIGVTDIAVDPRDPNRIYAATWQRHRTVAAYMGGGPGSGLHRSTDGGQTWEELSNGLPKSWMGKIGLAISPQNPDILYAAIELDRRTGAVYRSADRGSSWVKGADAVSGATGPHYYQELYASPHHFERLYLVDVRVQVSDNGGKTFYRMKEENKHSDNHSIAFRKNDPNYLLVGTDGGIYESFDLTETWRFIDNLPLTQFYKVALDDTEPFYNVYGGTQDNGSHGGPVRTDNLHGIQNSDWFYILNADGHQPATEPGNPNIVYAERQQGYLFRIDMATGEVIGIQPQPEANEDYERFNWDAPILVSPHSPSRLYFGSQRVWRSDNRGDKWTAVSGDLTRNESRIELPIMDAKQSWDAPWDLNAMSNYNTITSLAESPKQEGLLYAGTDDGILQVTENGGTNWKKIEVGDMPGVPSTAFINDVKADLYDTNTVYVALDNHKYGDYKPYLLKSTDKGDNWTSITGNLPDKLLVWRLVQDHVRSDLLFLATEFGIYFTLNNGGEWTKITGGLPTISFRDLAIQKRENDLVGASFGRSFYVLDDYSPLREVSAEQMAEEATLFSTRDAWWYIQRPKLRFEGGRGNMGASHFVADNPPFGAVITYYLKEGYKTNAEKRKEAEEAISGGDIPFPGWETVDQERIEIEPRVLITIKDSDGNVIRKINAPRTSGFHRVAWDLRYPPLEAIGIDGDEDDTQGFMAAPGNYIATLSKVIDGTTTHLTEPISFNVKPLHKGSLPGAKHKAVVEFWKSYEKTNAKQDLAAYTLEKAIKKASALSKVLLKTGSAPGVFDKQLYEFKEKLHALDMEMNGNRSKQQVGEKRKPTVGARLSNLRRSIERSTYGPNETMEKTMDIVSAQLADMEARLKVLTKGLDTLYNEMIAAGGPEIEQ